MRTQEKLIYTNERGDSIEFSPASSYHVNFKDVTGLSDVRNAIYSTNSMGQDGDTYLGYRIESRDIDIVGYIKERDKQSKITDQRLNTSLCGVVAAVVQQIDTAAFNAQLQAWFAEYQSLSAAEYNTLVSYMNSLKLQGNTQYEAFEQHMADFETQAAADFNAWFNGLQNVLDDNAATNLLNVTNALDARVDMLEAVLFNDITTNPFLILFDDLDGVTSTGIWNESLQRIEC